MRLYQSVSTASYFHARQSNKESLIELASSDLKKVLMLLKKGVVIMMLIIGINAPMGR